MIISGANVETPALELEAFWHPLVRVVEWAKDNVASVLCSCLASHALWQHLTGSCARRSRAANVGACSGTGTREAPTHSSGT